MAKDGTVERFTREHIETWLARLAATRRPSTVHDRFVALQAFYRWAVREREVPASPMAGAPRITMSLIALATSR